jgi:hypothetical protein
MNPYTMPLSRSPAPIFAPREHAPQFELTRDLAVLALVTFLPGVLLLVVLVAALAGVTGTTLLGLLFAHITAQFIVLVVYGTILVRDQTLDRLGRAMWAAMFLFAAPLSLPAYLLLRLARPMPPMGRVEVVDLPLAYVR